MWFMGADADKIITKTGGATSKAFAGSVTVQIASNFWMKWLEIAAEHARIAREARARAEQAPAGSPEMGQAFDDELKASLVAVTASAFAIDAWYIAVQPMIPTPQVGKKAGRDAWVIETLKAGFKLGPAAARWGSQIKPLYRLRDGVVHHTSIFSEGQPHPTGLSNVAKENAVYTAEEAVRAVDLAVDVMTHCLATPRSRYPDLVTWCEDRAHVIEFFRDKRKQELG
jgi:hypothetical protein